jgi:hypothetical protein
VPRMYFKRCANEAIGRGRGDGSMSELWRHGDYRRMHQRRLFERSWWLLRRRQESRTSDRATASSDTHRAAIVSAMRFAHDHAFLGTTWRSTREWVGLRNMQRVRESADGSRVAVAQVWNVLPEGTPVGQVRSRSTGVVSPVDARGSGLAGHPRTLRAAQT